jgi:hypothetical protein
MIEPFVGATGDEYVKLFYKYIWFKIKSPEIENFGKRFFLEIADTHYQIHLVKAFMKIMQSLYTEIYDQHKAILTKFVPK